MGYCVNSSGALVPFANDRTACSSVGGKYVEDIKPTFSQDGGNALNPNTWIDASEKIAGYGMGEGADIRKGELPPIGAALDVLNPIPEVMGLIKNLSDPELRAATWEFVKQNPLKATAATVSAFIAKKAKKLGTLTRLGYYGHVGHEALESDYPLMDTAKREIEEGIFNLHRGETETKEAKEIRIAKEKETKAAQDKKDKEAADKLVADKKAKAEAYANRSFSERFKAGMKDPTTLNKLGMLMDYYGRNLQDRGENPLIAYEEAKADQMAASKPDSSTFNAVDMSDTVLTDLFTPSKGWMFFGKNEQERKTAAADMIGRYRTIQNAAFTRHGVILTHGEIMALLEDERDKAAAAQKAAANK